VAHALEQKQLRDKKRQAEEALRKLKEFNEGIFVQDVEGLFSFDINPPPLVEDPDRFYRSGEK